MTQKIKIIGDIGIDHDDIKNNIDYERKENHFEIIFNHSALDNQDELIRVKLGFNDRLPIYVNDLVKVADLDNEKIIIKYDSIPNFPKDSVSRNNIPVDLTVSFVDSDTLWKNKIGNLSRPNNESLIIFKSTPEQSVLWKYNHRRSANNFQILISKSFENLPGKELRDSIMKILTPLFIKEIIVRNLYEKKIEPESEFTAFDYFLERLKILIKNTEALDSINNVINLSTTIGDEDYENDAFYNDIDIIAEEFSKNNKLYDVPKQINELKNIINPVNEEQEYD